MTTRGKSYLLVIDASVMQSAGESQKSQVSISCREILLAVKNICHKVALTTEICSEWQRHQSNFSRKWFASMAARRKTRTLALSDQPYLLTALIEKTSLSIKDQRALLKDKPLIEAALACDKIILTRDRSLRQTLERYQRLRGIAKDIRWINPEIEGPHSIEQL